MAGLASQARVATERAVQYSFNCQRSDGHWVAEVSSDATFTSEYVMFKYAIGLDLQADGDAIKAWLLSDQKPDGSWGLAPELPGNVSTTTEAYLALKILGLEASHPRMRLASDFMIKNGGVAKVRFFTRFFLATFGLFPYSAIPQIPAELILLPSSLPLNIYVLSSWARSTLIPVLVVAHHQPIYALPNGKSATNDFLDELWVDPSNKNVPYAPPLLSSLGEAEFVRCGFTALDMLLGKMFNGLRTLQPLRSLSRKKCISWLLEHQEEAGDWAGFFPPMHGSIWALILEGFPLDSKPVVLGLEALERLAFSDEKGKRIAATVSPVWDTALMASALSDAGFGKDKRVQVAVDWVKDKQLSPDGHGDWRIYSPNSQGNGWSFEYNNTWYPDVDDSAVVIMALLKQDPSILTTSDSIQNSVIWILGMQNHDGGWGAFDINNDKMWLHKIPFSDMDSLCDPSSADITGRIIECFGMLLAHRPTDGISASLTEKIQLSSQRGIAYLMKEQAASTDAWWGRWGNNYIYGSSNVLRGLAYFAQSPGPELNAQTFQVRDSIARAVRWFESIQNPDGGWGESLRSYTEPEYIGRAESTAAQTAWAIQALLPFRRASSKCIERGIQWLITNQTVGDQDSVDGGAASWPSDFYTGTGFPCVLYLGYPYYHHAFPITALSEYVRAAENESHLAVSSPIILQDHISSALNRPDVLLMVAGSRGDIEPFIRMGKRLQEKLGYRVRIATHPTHQDRVERQHIEFYSVGGDPRVFAETFNQRPDIVASFLRGDFSVLKNTFHRMIARYWLAAIDATGGDSSREKANGTAKLELKQNGSSGLPSAVRPFVADIVVSSLPTQAHHHAAESLQAPLVLVSIQPDIPTSEFPHIMTMTRPVFNTGRWWNYLSHICIQIVNWLAFGSYLNHLRTNVHRMRPKYLTWGKIPSTPHVCLWSSQVVPRAHDWDDNVRVAGYAYPSAIEFNEYKPPKALENFLDSRSNQPIFVFGFGSMNIADPDQLLSSISGAVAQVGARAVVILPDHAKKSADGNTHGSNSVFITDDVPHEWLLPRSHGFIHHGGAGHTAMGLRHGIPMVLTPFFLDQNFWAARVRQMRLGPAPIPFRELTEERLAAALRDMLPVDRCSVYRQKCLNLAAKIALDEDGAEIAAATIAQQVQRPESAHCCLIPALRAEWRHLGSNLPLSLAAAAALTDRGVLSWSDLRPYGLGNVGSSRETTTSALTKVINMFVGLLWSFLQILLSNAKGTGASEGSVHNTISLARMRKGQYDLNLVREGELAQGNDLEARLVQDWRSVVSSRFRTDFSAEGGRKDSM
ncbi:hypothetical protein diail_480 [Diaporthe ilicicola]|nr:hypothetical protein diail_480 [Diaporthe ilicicola]